MKIAISSTGNELTSEMSVVFGRADCFVIVDTETKKVVEVLDNYVAQSSAKGAGVISSTLVVDAGVTKVLSGMVGPKALSVLDKGGVGVVENVKGTIEEVINKLEELI